MLWSIFLIVGDRQLLLLRFCLTLGRRVCGGRMGLGGFSRNRGVWVVLML